MMRVDSIAEHHTFKTFPSHLHRWELQTSHVRSLLSSFASRRAAFQTDGEVLLAVVSSTVVSQ